MTDIKHRGYIISSIVTGLFGEAALAGIVLLLFPRWGVNIPIWGLILFMVALGGYEVISYRIGSKALAREPIVSLQAMIGCRGRATTPIAPNGYVRVDGELWRALSIGPNIDKGSQIVVVEVNRLTLFVAPLLKNMHGYSRAGQIVEGEKEEVVDSEKRERRQKMKEGVKEKC
jgi:membrane-bound ClpP family serine protease